MRTTLTKKLATLGIVGVSVAGLLAGAVKGIVSFVQNLLPSPTQKEGVRGIQLSAFFQPADAAVVGIGLPASAFLVQADDDSD